VRFVRADDAGAAALLEAVLSQDAGNADAIRLKAEIAYAGGNHASAMQDYQRLAAANPHDVATHFRLGLMHLERAYVHEAERIAEQIGELAPRDARGPYLKALCRWQQGNVREAMDLAALILRVQPDHAPSAYLDAAGSHDAGRVEDANVRMARAWKRPIYRTLLSGSEAVPDSSEQSARLRQALVASGVTAAGIGTVQSIGDGAAVSN